MIQQIAGQSFFTDLTDGGQRILLESGIEWMAKEGSYLFREGEPPSTVYLIAEGQVRMSKLTSEGKEFSLQLKQRNDLVGELGLFQTVPHSMTAEVVRSARVMCYPLKKLERLFKENPALAKTIMKWHTIQTQATQAKFRDLLLSGKTGALYATLIRFCHSYGDKTGDGIVIQVHLTNQEMARYIGTTRESVNRMLKDLKEKNVVHTRQGQITVKDIDYLKSFMGCWECPVDICTM